MGLGSGGRRLFLRGSPNPLNGCPGVSVGQFDSLWMLKAESMLNRKRMQEIKRTPCLCEKAMAGCNVEGDRLCVGAEMVLEMRQSKT